jgi:hypothetical protein
LIKSRYASININFDSLAEAYGFPDDFDDKSFSQIAQRFFNLSDKYKFKYTIFVVGRDLENPKNAEAVKEWSSRGHEIGNHSYSHRRDIGTLTDGETRKDIEKAHNIITKITGIEPKGFISASWASSKWITKALIDLDYLYDTSYFPSWLMYGMDVKNFVNHIGSPRILSTIKRKDFHIPIIGHRQAFKKRQGNGFITVIPLPTGRFRMACWNTTGFIFGSRFQEKLVNDCLRDIGAFYYLLHPADLTAPEDLDLNRKLYLERMEIPLRQKVTYLDNMLGIIFKSDRKIVTMVEMAKEIEKNAKGSKEEVTK